MPRSVLSLCFLFSRSPNYMDNWQLRPTGITACVMRIPGTENWSTIAKLFYTQQTVGKRIINFQLLTAQSSSQQERKRWQSQLNHSSLSLTSPLSRSWAGKNDMQCFLGKCLKWELFLWKCSTQLITSKWYQSQTPHVRTYFPKVRLCNIFCQTASQADGCTCSF